VSCATPRYVRLVDKLFVDGLGRRRWRELRGHLAECERCRAYYDRVARVWQAMGPGATPPAVAESMAEDLIETLVPGRARRWSLRFAALGGVLAAAGIALVVGLRVGEHHGMGMGSGTGEWQERGAEAHRARGVRAFCLGASPAGETPGETVVRGAVSTVTAHGGPPGVLRCRLEDALQFAYTLGPGAGEHLVVVGEDAAGQLHWYSAPPDAGPAIALQPGALEEPLQASVRLGLRHPAGRLEVTALFAGRALSADEVRRVVAAHGDAPRAGVAGIIDAQRLTVELGR
jgi:hypothetical protein